MKAIIEPGMARGRISAPPSKSCAHRLLICAALAAGESRIDGAAMSQDILRRTEGRQESRWAAGGCSQGSPRCRARPCREWGGSRSRCCSRTRRAYEEVYQDRFYGTLKSQVENQLAAGESVMFDVDVKGGVNIKKFYGERALSIFVQPPSVEELRRRLNGRGTDAPEVIEQRLAKASYELTFAPQFDHVVVNDDLEKAEQEVYELVHKFLSEE